MRTVTNEMTIYIRMMTLGIPCGLDAMALTERQDAYKDIKKWKRPLIALWDPVLSADEEQVVQGKNELKQGSEPLDFTGHPKF